MSALQALRKTLFSNYYWVVLVSLQALVCLIVGNICCSKVNFDERSVDEVWYKRMPPGDQAMYHVSRNADDSKDS